MNGGTPTTAEAMATPAPWPPSPDESSPRPILLDGETAYGKRVEGNGNGSQVAHDYDSPELPARHPDLDDAQQPTTIVQHSPTMRPQMTIDLDDSPMDALFDSKLSLEDASPKPCIVPGNALHLIDDDPSPRSVTPSSVVILSNHDELSDQDGDHSPDHLPDAERPALRVRFRSRVRITSGLHRHRHDRSVSAPNAAGANGARQGTPGSSVSDSPSSSISAPLRYQADENAAWGPLGKRLSAYASANGWSRRGTVPAKTAPERPSNARGGGRTDTAALLNERTSLLAPSRGVMYGAADDEGSREREASEIEQREREVRAALRREEDAVFGKWPWRIFNHHWWWWHIEPMLCCCMDDVDYDES